jgi:deoxyadenosine/deoxycytidine kinase
MPGHPWLVAVCGLMGAGKTTLARGIARALDWTYLPEVLPATRYLPDLFTDSHRWAFETQIAFLIYKSRGIRENVDRDHDLVVDRSLAEDSNIFARYFHECGDIDDRSYGTYLALVEHLTASLPPLDAAILCECPLEVARQRIHKRGREFERRYPPGHLERISELYEAWIAAFDDTDVYAVDTFANDVRDPVVAGQVASDLAIILNAQLGQGPQLSLFDSDHHENVFVPALLRALRTSAGRAGTWKRQVIVSQKGDASLPFPSAYIAAPFTSHAIDRESVPGLLFDFQPSTGLIGRGRFRRMLTGIDSALRGLGVTGFLPHRDISKWGKRKITPEQLTELCTAYVREADILVGIPGLSQGSHYELGLAIGISKPVIVIQCNEIPGSFVASGLRRQRDRLLVLSCSNMDGIPKLIRSREVVEFLALHVPITS